MNIKCKFYDFWFKVNCLKNFFYFGKFYRKNEFMFIYINFLIIFFKFMFLGIGVWVIGWG